MSKMQIGMIIRPRIRASRDILATGDQLNKALGLTDEQIEKNRLLDAQVSRTLRSSLNVLTTVQIARFKMKDIQDLATGQGGLTDIISLAMSSILLTSQLQMMLKDTLLMQTAVNAMQSASLATGLSVGGVALAGGAILGSLALTAGLVSTKNFMVKAAIEAEESQRTRLQIYRSIVGN